MTQQQREVPDAQAHCDGDAVIGIYLEIQTIFHLPNSIAFGIGNNAALNPVTGTGARPI